MVHLEISGIMTVWLLSLAAFVAADTLVVYSQDDSALISTVSELIPNSSLAGMTEFYLFRSESIENAILTTRRSRVIDLTGSARSRFPLQRLTHSVSLPLLFYQAGQLSAALDSQFDFPAINSLLRFFHWDVFNVLTTVVYAKTIEALTEVCPFCNPLVIESESDYEEMRRIAGRLLKQGGVQYFLLLGPTDFVEKLLLAAWERKLYHKGAVFIVGSESNALARSLLSRLQCGILQFSLFPHIPTDPADRLLRLLTVPPYCDSCLALFNVEDAEYDLVGFCSSSSCRLTKSVIFPGCVSETPSDPYANLLFSLPLEAQSANEEASLVQIKGAVSAIRELNASSDILPNFYIVWQSYYFGIFDFNATAAVRNAEKLSFHFGSMVSAALSTPAVIGLFALFRSANVTVPIVGSEVTLPVLSSPTSFPHFVRTIVSDAYTAFLYARLFRQMGWKRCSVLYRRNVWAEGFYLNFSAGANLSGIEISNREDFRQIPDDFPQTYPLSSVSHPITDEIVRVKTRIVLLITIEADVIRGVITSLYRSGVRRGDVVLVAVGWLIDGIWTYFDGSFSEYLAELLPGAVIAFPASYIGRTGGRLKDAFRREFRMEPPAGTCLFYDSTMMVAHALDFVLQSGNDPEDCEKVMESIRTTKFQGCSGAVSIDSSSNDRAQMTFLIQNLKFTAENSTWKLDSVLLFNPYSTTLLTAIGEFQWPDGTATTPTDTVLFDIDCPFQSRQLRVSTVGRAIMETVAALIAVVVGLTTAIIWRKWWNVRVKPLTTRQEISSTDVVVLGSIVVEFLQNLAMGPDSSELISALPTIGESVTLNFSTVLDMRQGGFWLLLDVVFASCTLWLFALFMLHFDLWRLTSKLCLLPTIQQLLDALMPILGGLCFLPITSLLTEVFLCDLATGDSLSDTVLSKDCYQHCWVPPHTLYVSLSTLFLTLYVPTAVFHRPLWQEFRSSLHVKTQPGFLMAQTVFQVTLILMNKTIKRIWPLPHSLLFMTVVCGFAGWTVKYPPFNYSRPNLWQAVLLFAAGWIGLIDSVMRLTSIGAKGAVYALMGGWGTLGLVGLLVQIHRCPSLLYRKKGQSISVLFQFQLSRSKIDPRTISPRLNKAPSSHVDTLFG